MLSNGTSGENLYRIAVGNAVDSIIVIQLDDALKIQVGLNKIKLRELSLGFYLFLHKFIKVDIEAAPWIVLNTINNFLCDGQFHQAFVSRSKL